VVQPSLEPADEEKAEPPILEWDAPKFTPPPVQPTHATTASNEVWSGGSATVETPVQAPRPAPVLTAVETAKVTPLHEAKPAVGLDLDKLDLSFDPQRAPVEDPTPSVLDGQWHDAATKLDLARAYQEMGDLEGAREILQEVLHEGDPDQKREAQTLLDKLRAA
jgi:FimV-like protein